MVFYGEYTVAFTNGGRLVLPKKLRELVKGNEFVLTKGFDTCLAGYDKEDWEDRSKEFVSRSLIDTENLPVRRMLFSGAVYVELDEQGRFVLPKQLLDFSELSNKAIIVGVGDHFEIWSQERWTEYEKKAQAKSKLRPKVWNHRLRYSF